MNSTVAPPARVHGGPQPDELQALGLTGQPLLDFSVNVNPYGPSARVLAAVAGARLDVYPDATAGAARAALASHWGVTSDQVALGNGAAELLWTCVALLCPPGKTLLVVEPTFCEPALAAVARGAGLVRVVASPESGFAVLPDAVVAAARAASASAVYLCNPQNPTGRALPGKAVAVLAQNLAPATLILDEAFLSVSTHHGDAALVLPENVVRVRSFTKEHALPGLRLGALLAAPALVARLELARPAWTVSAPAQAAITVCAGLGDFVAEVRGRWLADTAGLAADLAGLGLSPLPSDTVYLLCPVGQGQGARVRLRLLAEHGVLVRDAASFGLPGYLRLGGRPAEDRGRLIRALAAVLGR